MTHTQASVKSVESVPSPLQRTIADNITRFAEDNKLLIHPGQNAEKWAELVIKKGGCPCVPGRTKCPCDFVQQDIAELGRCRCGLFCNESYLRQYQALTLQRKRGRRGRKSSVRISQEDCDQRILHRR